MVVAVTDRNLCFIEVSLFLASCSGRSVEELRGRPLNALPQALAAKLGPPLQQVLATGESLVTIERRADAPARSVSVSYHPLRSQSGVIVAIDILATTSAPEDLRAIWLSLERGAAQTPGQAERREERPERDAASDGVEQALRDSERRWRSLIGSVNQGFCIFEMLYDEAGAPVDYRFLEVNPTFEHHTGLVNAVGRTARELVPGLELDWVRTYALVVESGEPLRFEQESPAMGRWFEVDAVRVGGPGSREVALLFSDITARRLAEADADLVATVIEQIRLAADGDALLARVSEMLGTYLKVARCSFIEVDAAGEHWVIRREYCAAPALPLTDAARALAACPENVVATLRAGQVVVISDTAEDRRTRAADLSVFSPLGARAAICVPLLNEGLWVATCAVFAAEARAWAPREVALIEAVVGQTWSAVEQLRTLEQLRTSQARLALAIQAGHAGIFEWDIRNNVNRWSPELEALYGLPPGSFEASYEAWRRQVDPEDVDAVEAGLLEAMEERRDEHAYEFRVVLPDGSRRWLAGRGRFEYDPEGAPLRMIGINIDIDDRKRGEEALRRAHERLSLALERLDGFLYEYHIDTGFTERSEGFARVIGYDPETVPAHSEWWRAQIHPDDLAFVIASMDAAQHGAAAGYAVEYRVRHRDGHYRTVWDRGQIERDAHGRAVRVLGTTINISERKQAEAERLELLVQVQQALEATEVALAGAEAATRERDLLISIAAHDLRSPLTVILGQAQLLQRRAARTGLDERDQRTVALIADQAERLNQMIEALLDVSRIQEGRLTIMPQPLDLVGALERVVGAVRSTVSVHELALSTPRSTLTINADPIRLEQVLHNLLGNAVKYSPNGGQIEVAVEAAADMARIYIRDQGIGIPTEALPHLFTRFYRAPNATRQATSSMGVGLYVVRELVQAHGGSIRVESIEGVGSTFTVELPLGETQL
jgi:PAS domain S-box-containing protein